MLTKALVFDKQRFCLQHLFTTFIFNIHRHFFEHIAPAISGFCNCSDEIGKSQIVAISSFNSCLLLV